MKELWTTIIVAVAIILFGAWFWRYENNNVRDESFLEDSATDSVANLESALDDAGGNTDTDTDTDTDEDSLTVENQKAGKVVHVSELHLLSERWVIVHEDADGLPGKILGAKLFDKDAVSADVPMVVRPTETGKTYHVLLHKSDGDPSRDLTLSAETPVLDFVDDPIDVTFLAL